MDVLAVDVGGVLASKQHDGEPVDGAYHAIKCLENHFEIWITSQCGRNRALRTREWLEKNGFPIPKSRQLYIGFDEKNKNRILEQINAVEFIDDKPKHLLPAMKIVNRVWHFAENPLIDAKQFRRYRHVKSWPEILEKLL